MNQYPTGIKATSAILFSHKWMDIVIMQLQAFWLSFVLQDNMISQKNAFPPQRCANTSVTFLLEIRYLTNRAMLSLNRTSSTRAGIRQIPAEIFFSFAEIFYFYIFTKAAEGADRRRLTQGSAALGGHARQWESFSSFCLTQGVFHYLGNAKQKIKTEHLSILVSSLALCN